MSTLLLVDAYAYIHQGYHANPNLVNGAAYLFTRTLQTYLQHLTPTHAAVVFDSGGSTHRQALLPTYKEGRNATPEPITAQLPLIHEIVAALGLTSISMLGHEADDLLASLTHQATQAPAFQRIYIATPDKDMLQLVNDSQHVAVVSIKDRKLITYDEAGVQSRLGVHPTQVVDYLALVGDTSDAIKGVPGIGDKGACRLLKDFGSLNHLIQASASPRLPVRQGTAILESLRQIPLAKNLLTVVKDLRVPDPRSLRYAPPEDAVLRRYFMDKRMPTLAPDIDEDFDD